MVRKSLKTNIKIIFILITFFIISLISIYNASTINNTVDNALYKQIIWILICLLVMYIILKKGNNILIKYSFLIYIILNIILLSLLIFGKEINNSKCWIIIPKLGSFQPSEFVKIFLIITLSRIVSKSKIKGIKSEIILIIKCLIIFIIPSILTFLEPDTGAVIIYFIILISILFISKIRLRWFIICILLLTMFIISCLYLYNNNLNVLIKIFGSSLFLRIERIINWSNNEGMQLTRGLTSIGSGGIFGNDLIIYFPEAHTDFIFAVWSSKYGYIGSIILIILFWILDNEILKIAKNSKKNINKYITIGILSIFFYQQIQNIGMTFGLFPITGITLPFISYGGSSLLSNIIMISIIMNINYENKKKNN